MDATATRVIKVCLVLVLAVLHETSGSSWGYFGADNEAAWGGVDAKCSGSSQSPINIVTSSATSDSIASFSMTGFDTTTDLSLKLVNNGHTAKLSVEAGDVKISGGGLSGDYTVAQLHFHWGNTTAVGSEHTVDGTQYPMEVHLVTYKASYGDINTAIGNNDGLAVIGFFFEQDASLTTPTGLTTIVDALSNVQSANAEYNMTAFKLDTLIPTDFTTFYRYSGSLTTPTCNEVVTWTVVKAPLGVTQAQMDAFRNLEMSELNDEGTNKMYNNYRSVQALNGRSVTMGMNAGYRTSIHLPIILIPILSMLVNKL